MQAATIGLDIAKQVFQVHGADKSSKVLFRRKLRRSEVARFFGELEPCLVGMEASGSAHYWAGVLTVSGHMVRLIAPQFVKPYVKSNKNDANDVEAICEAVTRPASPGSAVPAPCAQAAGRLPDSAFQPDPRLAG